VGPFVVAFAFAGPFTLDRQKHELPVALDLQDDRVPRPDAAERAPQLRHRRDRRAVDAVDRVAGLQP
jgi:hypothetical protein